MKKLIALLLSVLIIMSVSLSCSKEKTDNVDWHDGEDMGSEIMTISDKSGPKYSVVIPDGATSAVRFAASELSSFVGQVTGSALSILSESDYSGETFISIGRTQKLASSGISFDYETLNEDGFFIKTVEKAIYIDGKNDRARLYGAYEFVERFGGVRFLTADATHVPAANAIAVRQLNIVEAPVFRQRNYYGGGIGNDPVFEARFRMYSDFSVVDPSVGYTSDWYRGISTHHNTLSYVPPLEYKSAHPEWYRSHYEDIKQGEWDEIDFTNGITEEGKIDESMNESIAKVALKNLKKFILEAPDAKFFMIGQSDGMNFAPSPTALVRSEKYGGKSGVYVVFINALAREIEKWRVETCPDREINVVMFAYLWTVEPPVTFVEGKAVPISDKMILEKNVHVRLAPIDANFAFGYDDPRQNTKEANNIAGWSALSKNLMIWDYGTFFSQGYLWYFPNYDYLADNIRYFERHNATYMMVQSSNTTSRGDWQQYSKAYISSKLYWDSSLNARSLLEEFITLYNGSIAAPFISSFMEIMEIHYAEMREIKNVSFQCVMPNWPYLGPDYYPTSLLEKAYNVLMAGSNAIEASTMTAAEKELYQKRLGEVIMIPQYMILENFDAYQFDMESFVNQFHKNARRAGLTMTGENVGYSVYISKFPVTLN